MMENKNLNEVEVLLLEDVKSVLIATDAYLVNYEYEDVVGNGVVLASELESAISVLERFTSNVLSAVCKVLSSMLDKVYTILGI